MVQHFITSIQMNDRTVINRAKDAPADFLSELDRVWKTLDPNARGIAVLMLEKIDSGPAAAFLLRVTADPNAQVAAAAARVLLDMSSLPAGDMILNLIPSRESPFVRGKLYLAAGKANCGLDALRRTAAMEADPGAAGCALAAMVRRGGAAERIRFMEQVEKARPDEVLEFSRQILYINEPNLAKAMVPWLDSTEGVMRIGYDAPGKDRQARMCDFAIWNGKLLGHPTSAGDAIANYEPAHVSRIRKLFAELPDPEPPLV